jgi:hypothetical protein
MTYKQSITMDKAWDAAEVSAIPFAGIFAKLKNAVKINIPVGYQDESGFHLGVKPDGQEVQWPQTW